MSYIIYLVLQSQVCSPRSFGNIVNLHMETVLAFKVVI